MDNLTPFEDDPHQELVEKVDAEMDVVWGRWDSATRPIIEGALAATRSVTNLSAGALILSLSITQVIQDRLTEATASAWLLPVAWVLLTIAIIAGVTRQGRVVGAVSQRATFEMNRGQVRRRVRQIDLDAHVGAQIDQILTEAMESVDISNDIRFFDFLGFIQGWSFVLAFVSLVVFTLLNMPF